MVKHTHLKLPQTIEIHQYLDQRITKLGDGTCYYNDSDMNDQAVAEHHGVTVNQVRHIRLQMFGELRRGPITPPPSAVDTVAREVIGELLEMLDAHTGISVTELGLLKQKLRS